MSTVQKRLEKPINVWIADSVLGELISECERVDPYETGGVLLGYWGDEAQDPVITHSVGPGPDAVHQRDRFAPDQLYQLAEIARLYNSSERTLRYLGDWHSHPGGSGGLSTLDRRTLRRIAECRTARVARPLMMVLAGKSIWEPTAWIYERVWRWCFPGWDALQLGTIVFDDADERR